MIKKLVDPIFLFRDMKPSLRYVVEGLFCVTWKKIEPYRTDLDQFDKKSKFYQRLDFLYKKTDFIENI